MAEHTDGQFDITAFRLVKEHCQEMQNGTRKLNLIYQEMERLYWMEWGEEANVKRQIDNVKLTRSPRARIAIKGAEHLLTATDPQFMVPTDINLPGTNLIGDKLERFAKAMWFASGRIAGDPIHYDVVRSGLLYSDIHIRITSTKELLKFIQGSNPAMLARAEYVAEKTPYLFEVTNPQEGVPEWGALGLQAFYRRVKTTSGYVMDNWGSRGEAALRSHKDKSNPTSRYITVYLNDLYDNRDRVVWLDECERPIYQEAHGLPFIPAIAQIVEGSRGLFATPEKQREPFLYTLYRSGIINRQHLFLTVIYTLMFAMGANPMFVNYLMDPDNPPKADYSKPGGQINMRVGERREPMSKIIVDPSLMQGWDIANTLEQESTIYRQTLGEPLGMNAPYSMVALLSQTGRLPLVSAQRKSGWAISEAVELAMKWLRFGGQSATAYNDKYSVKIEPKDIPEHFEIQASLEVNLPQDQLNAANAANVLANGDEPMVSKRWVRENVLNIGQSRDMTYEIWAEKAAEMQNQMYQNDQLMRQARAAQAAQQAGAAGGMPGGQPGVTAPPGPPTPEQPGMQPNPMPMEPIPPQPPMLANQMPMEGEEGME